MNIKEMVRKKYGEIASEDSSCCAPSCCGTENSKTKQSMKVGYSEAELKEIPEAANLGLGCGNPVALASLQEGETVLDLGSGAGIDCFLAAKKVGKKGKVIGVDMTPAMLDRARKNAQDNHFDNVEFRLGEIENLPVADNAVDVIISNCVINLAPDKERVFQEAYRVLKPGGRIMVSDIVVSRELPREIAASVEAYVGCVAGAKLIDAYLDDIKKAGFEDIEIQNKSNFPVDNLLNDPLAKSVSQQFNMNTNEMKKIIESILSIKVYAVKPK